MEQTLSFLKREHAYFQQLGKDAQCLLFSFAITGISSPILFIFLNTFLWDKSSNLLLIAWYNTALFLGIPFGFYMNGYLLRKYSPTTLYLIGNVMQGVVASLLFFFSFISYPSLFLFGFSFGIAMAIYWANRNLLTLRVTNPSNRIYFSSLESTFATPLSIIMPFIIGWFIYFGRIAHWYSLNQAYQALAVFSIFILFLVGIVVRSVRISFAPMQQVLVKKASKHWHIYRIFMFFSGIGGGITIFLPTIMILSFLGKENAVGTVQAGASIFSAIAIYFVGRYATPSHRIQIFFISFLLLLVAGLSFSIFFSGVGVLLYFTFISLQSPFGWSGTSSISQDTIDTEEGDSPYSHYAFLSDIEIFLNAGRITGILLFYILTIKLSNSFALRYTPFLLGASQVALIFMAQMLDKRNLTKDKT